MTASPATALDRTGPLAELAAPDAEARPGALGAAERWLSRNVPRGAELPDAVWHNRHRAVLIVLWVHVVVLTGLGVTLGFSLLHTLLETSVVAAAALLGGSTHLARGPRSAIASAGLVTCSALLVHLTDGTTESHFHFFVVIALLTLYQSWIPFLVGLTFVVLHHGLLGTVSPTSVFDHAAAIAEPWKWAFIHGGFVLAASVANIVTWRLNEDLLEEVERRAAQNELILKSAGEGIFGLDARGVVTFVNQAAAAMTSYAADEMIGLRLHELVHHSRPDGSRYPLDECPVEASLADGEVHRSAGDVYWRKDGTSFPVEYTSTPMFEDGRVAGAVVVFKDVSERREMERVKDQFTSIVSHELRTPLTSIRGSLGLLAGGAVGELPDRAQRMADIAVSNSDRLVRLINDILDIERVESGQAMMRVQSCDAAELLSQAIETVEAVASDAGVELLVDAQPAAILADGDRVIQTLTNLLANAIKFSPSGTQVRARCAVRDREMLFEVTDQGRGIPADKLESIFDRFQQVDASDSREKGGTGLGLAICRSIVEQHDGRIWAQSAGGNGSTLSFVLPLPDEEPSAADRDEPSFADEAVAALPLTGGM